MMKNKWELKDSIVPNSKFHSESFFTKTFQKCHSGMFKNYVPKHILWMYFKLLKKALLHNENVHREVFWNNQFKIFKANPKLYKSKWYTKSSL